MMPKGIYKRRSVFDRFNDRVGNKNGCWIWEGFIGPNGYGQVTVNGKTKMAHRVSYQLFVGEIKDGLHVLHKCNNQKCVNPNHLYLGTHFDNMKDRKNAGNYKSGEFGYNAKLKRKEVDEIKLKYNTEKIPQRKLAYLYGVSKTQIANIVGGKQWIS